MPESSRSSGDHDAREFVGFQEIPISEEQKLEVLRALSLLHAKAEKAIADTFYETLQDGTRKMHERVDAEDALHTAVFIMRSYEDCFASLLGVPHHALSAGTA